MKKAYLGDSVTFVTPMVDYPPTFFAAIVKFYNREHKEWRRSLVRTVFKTSRNYIVFNGRFYQVCGFWIYFM